MSKLFTGTKDLGERLCKLVETEILVAEKGFPWETPNFHFYTAWLIKDSQRVNDAAFQEQFVNPGLQCLADMINKLDLVRFYVPECAMYVPQIVHRGPIPVRFTGEYVFECEDSDEEDEGSWKFALDVIADGYRRMTIAEVDDEISKTAEGQ